jgi:hypothetical protein
MVLFDFLWKLMTINDETGSDVMSLWGTARIIIYTTLTITHSTIYHNDAKQRYQITDEFKTNGLWDELAPTRGYR